MYMKTKGKYKKSGSADRRFCGLRLFHDRWGVPRTANTAVRATPKSGEQSENVYENKGQVQNVAEAHSARPSVGHTSLVRRSEGGG
jgi:phage terminase large subunit-like protein